MKEHPIIFQTESIRSILAGEKTQTRRIIGKRPRNWQVGDVLWVKEKWKRVWEGDEEAFVFASEYTPVALREIKGWKNSIYMPRKSVWLFLEITELREERLLSISDEDLSAEGFGSDSLYLVESMHNFVKAWDSINKAPGKRWEDNPRVLVVEFSVLHDYRA